MSHVPAEIFPETGALADSGVLGGGVAAGSTPGNIAYRLKTCRLHNGTSNEADSAVDMFLDAYNEIQPVSCSGIITFKLENFSVREVDSDLRAVLEP